MPNVMGQEFPYTPEGMAAAEQYRQTLGMRDGGMMGFRPIGMQEGGLADATAIVQGLYDLMGSGTTSDVRDYISLHRMSLEKSAKIDDRFFNTLRNMLPRFPAETLTPAAPMDRPRSERFGAAPEYGTESPMPELPPQGHPDVTEPFGVTGDPELDEVLKSIDRSLRETPIMPPRQNKPRLRGMELMPPYMMDPRFEGYYNPNQLNPYFNPNEIAVANGGYITRDRNRGGLMSLRRR